jgi:hypothetical protein
VDFLLLLLLWLSAGWTCVPWYLWLTP